MFAVLKSPLLHFVVLGVVAYFAYAELKPNTLETITVTTQTIDALIQQQESIAQYALSDEEKQLLIAGHIEDEILLREAYKRGFDKNDGRVRRRLLGIMRSSMTEVIPEPSAGQLRAFYEENKEEYMSGPSRSFQQIYFSFTSEKLPADPEQFIQQLENSTNISGLGDFIMMGEQIKKATFEYMAGSMGKPFAEQVLALPVNEWAGPIESFRGLHYVRVTETHEPELPPFENMENFLRDAYYIEKGRESQEMKIDALRQNYRVVVEGTEVQEG